MKIWILAHQRISFVQFHSFLSDLKLLTGVLSQLESFGYCPGIYLVPPLSTHRILHKTKNTLVHIQILHKTKTTVAKWKKSTATLNIKLIDNTTWNVLQFQASMPFSLIWVRKITSMRLRMLALIWHLQTWHQAMHPENIWGAIHLWHPQKSALRPPSPLLTWTGPPLWTPTRGRHEIHTALLKQLVKWPTGRKAEIWLWL